MERFALPLTTKTETKPCIARALREYKIKQFKLNFYMQQCSIYFFGPWRIISIILLHLLISQEGSEQRLLWLEKKYNF